MLEQDHDVGDVVRETTFGEPVHRLVREPVGDRSLGTDEERLFRHRAAVRP
jgi:hypothetical protein